MAFHPLSFSRIVRPMTFRVSVDKSNSFESNPPVFQAFDGMTPRAPTTGLLSVLNVDMRSVDNKMAHNTIMYKSSSLIVRRNKEFFMVIRFDRPFIADQDNVLLEFMIGSSPDENKGTYMILSIGKEQLDGRWKARMVQNQGNEVMVGVTPDSNCIIGRFRMFVVVVSDVGKQRTQRNPDTDVYVLFNPWDPADQVYLPQEADREEYVMNDVGIMYNGEFKNITSRSWNFGQFEEGVLDACLVVLDAGKVPLLYRGNATEIARQASALMNSQNDDGVMVCSWSGDYSLGTAPTAWTGSPEILLKYAREGCVPVCFAQCWVFAGVLNTFMRCLGIPGRVVTNYCSAHDNNGNLKTDIVVDEDGRVDRYLTRDSVWNYHCWNEVYMKRSDLPEKFSGWQVLDCTPQETSDGLYRCGPTSVAAIKDGELSYPFDARFVFASLNSDVVYHKSNKYGNSKIIHVDSRYVGKLLITKEVNNDGYENVTSNYKHPEGSDMDKQAMEMAKIRGIPIRDYLPVTEGDVNIELHADSVQMGDDFKLMLNFKNKTTQSCTVDATVTGSVVFYTGVTSSTFKVKNHNVTVNGLSTTSVMIDVKSEDYMSKLVEQFYLLFLAHGSVTETDATVSTMKVVALRPPQLTIQVTGVPQVGKDLTVTVSFRNPYNFPLMKVELRLDGAGLTKTKVKQYEQIGSGATIQYTDTITPQTPGKRVLIGCLDCPAIRQVTNQVEIKVL